MKIKAVLSIICFIVPYSRSVEDKKRYPTRQEVLNTRHPLTIVLYASNEQYKAEKPALRIPKTSTLSDCLKKHLLLQSPWIHEKRFPEQMVDTYSKQLNMQSVKGVIENNDNYKVLEPITQILLETNLMQAFEDCLKATGARQAK